MTLDDRWPDEVSHYRASARLGENPLPRFTPSEWIERLLAPDREPASYAPRKNKRSLNTKNLKKRTTAIGEAALRWTAFAWRLLINHDNGLPADNSVALPVRLRSALDREVKRGLRVLAVGISIAGVWAVLFPLSAAVVAAGTLVVQSSVKKIQHPTGGVVAQILVQDGTHVEQGDLLARLDDTQARAKLQVIAQQLDEVRVRVARLNAERDDSDDLQFPVDLARRGVAPDVGRLLTSEKTLFLARNNSRKGQKDLIRNRISQLSEEVIGLEAQIRSKATQINLVTTELQGVQSLYDKQLVPLTRLTSLQRESAHLEGDRAQLLSSIAETKSKISEAELQVMQVDQDLRKEVMNDLRDAQDKEAELTEQKVSAQDQLNRIDIRAPTAGVVNQLSVHTIGGVISPAEVVMEIVPDADDLQIESRLQPSDIDQVRVGQTTHVRLSAFNRGTTPQLNGIVRYVSADLSRDQRTDAAYYKVMIALPADEVRRLGNGLQLVSGMPAEVFMQTGSRTVMSYLLKPITDHLQRAFNER